MQVTAGGAITPIDIYVSLEVGRRGAFTKHSLDAGHRTVLEIHLQDLHAVCAQGSYTGTSKMPVH